MIKVRICYAVIFAVEAALAWFYYSNIYSAKRSRSAFSMSFVLGYLFLFLLSIRATPALNLLMFFAVNFVLLLFNYKCSAKTGILQAAFLSFANGASEVLVNLILTTFSIDYNAYTYNFAAMLALVILSKLLYLVVVFLAAHIFKPQSSNLGESNLTSFLSVMPVVSIFVVVTIAYIAMTSKLKPVIEILAAISMLALLIVNLAVLILYGYIQSMAAENAALSISKAQDEANAEYYFLLRDQFDSQQIMIHDIRKHLGFVSDMLKEGNYTAAEQYIEELDSLPSLKRTIKLCDDPLLNVILTRYIEWSQELGISFQCNIRTSDFSFMDSTSITALFSNLLSNAVESAQYSEEKLIDFSVLKNIEEEYIMVSVVNSCDTAPQSDGKGSLKTTRAEGIHGFGIKSIERVVRQYGGLAAHHYDPATRSFHYTIRFPLSK